MRTFALFVALLAAALVAAAALTYPAWLLVGTVSVEPVHRVMNRLAMLIALVGLVVLTRRLRLSHRSALGYGVPRGEFLRQLGLGWAAGVGLMLPLVALLLVLDVRQIKPGLDGDLPAMIAAGIALGPRRRVHRGNILPRRAVHGSGAQRRRARRHRRAEHCCTQRCTSSAASCACRRNKCRGMHGFHVLSRLFERYAQPLAFVDSFLALVALGILLAFVRLRTGAIAACIGLHAAGVCAIFILRDTTVVNSDAKLAAIVGTYDGVIGWAALAWFAAIVVAYSQLYKPQLSSDSSRDS